MLYMQLAIDRAMAEAKLCEEKQQETTNAAKVILEDAQKECASRLAWAKNTKDPRIAVGSYSPLEKKIEYLGGIYSSDVRKLIFQELKKETEAVDKLKAVSFDSQSAKAETYYYKLQERMMEQMWNQTTEPEWEMKIEEEEKSQGEKSEDDEKWDYLVPERELNHIEKHIHRAERARGLRDYKYKLIPQKIPSEMLFPKITPYNEEREKVQHIYKRETKKPKVAWAKEQIKKHQERMIRGRKLTKQRNDERDAQKLSGYVPLLLKPQVKKVKEEFERVTAYPILQPKQKPRIEVTILMKKSKEVKIQKPLQREFLVVPPFLRSQLRKKKSIDRGGMAQVEKGSPNNQEVPSPNPSTTRNKRKNNEA
ncbi:putative uncharacterized protein ZNRD1-AS1 [Perognathus longimembris pacificus]|uniref:putative uncharacterized protein ZNRD1-AS1 n=1 Tax=Perognathus longimembris pacificus TaxID=214514 RepID=UPI002019ABD1|nr:putative uncharacterized protein ZNRD1-AS1 [Perognathus longimembris pacificus]